MGEAEELERLEESLWRTDTRFDREYMESILAPDFFEFGRSGRTYARDDTLSIEPSKIKAQLPLRDFKVVRLAEDVRLVTYTSEVWAEDGVELANRSSLWLRTTSGWMLKFHQGTPTRTRTG